MTRTEFIKRLEELDLPKSEFIILSGGSLLLRGLRESTADMDICVSEALAAALDLEHCPQDEDGCFSPFPDVQMKADMAGRAYDVIDGYRCQTLEDILAKKREWRRPKDLKDIAVIEEYLRSGGKNMDKDKNCAETKQSAEALQTEKSVDPAEEQQTGRFVKLAEENGGFEFVQAYRDEEDRFMGGKDGKFWYIIQKDGRPVDQYIGTLKDGEWKDVRIKGRGKSRKVTDMPAGTTIGLIEENAFMHQGDEWVQGRKAKLVEDSHPHLHYVYGFGDKALDVSEQYGVTIGWSDIKDVPAGFRLRDLSVGEDVELPE